MSSIITRIKHLLEMTPDTREAHRLQMVIEAVTRDPLTRPIQRHHVTRWSADRSYQVNARPIRNNSEWTP
jgi:hypothetical protein